MTGATFRTLRRQLGWTQARTAKELGVVSNTVARWEQGKRAIPEMAARFLALLLKEKS